MNPRDAGRVRKSGSLGGFAGSVPGPPGSYQVLFSDRDSLFSVSPGFVCRILKLLRIVWGAADFIAINSGPSHCGEIRRPGLGSIGRGADRSSRLSKIGGPLFSPPAARETGSGILRFEFRTGLRVSASASGAAAPFSAASKRKYLCLGFNWPRRIMILARI